MPRFRLRTGAAFIALVLATWPIQPAGAQSNEEPATARIIMGSHEGTAQPHRLGHGFTGGGNIDVLQPAPDTLVMTMSGATAVCANALTRAEAALDFCHGLQFTVEFSKPGCTGTLLMHAKLNGLLRATGRHSVVGTADTTTKLYCGPNEIAELPLAARTACCDGDSLALTASRGPIRVPIYAGHYSLGQQFQIIASQAAGLRSCKASADFSPSALPAAWIGTPDPFHGVNKEHLGYQLIVQVVPDPVPSNPSAADSVWNSVPPAGYPIGTMTGQPQQFEANHALNFVPPAPRPNRSMTGQPQLDANTARYAVPPAPRPKRSMTGSVQQGAARY